MSFEVVSIALTIIGLLGALAGVLIALFFRVGTFMGATQTELRGLREEQHAARAEHLQAIDTIHDRLSSFQGRVSALEAQQERKPH